MLIGLRAIEKSKSHPGIRRVKLLSNNKPEFKLRYFFPWEMKIGNKNSTAEIPVQDFKMYGDICLPPLGHWLIELGSANITPV